METVAIFVFVFGLYFGFPILGARVANKKGRTGWAKVIIITMFLGVGWIVAIYAFIIPPKFPESDLDETCPSCGGVKGSSQTALVDRNTGEPVMGQLGALILGALGLAIIAGALALAISVWQGGNDGIIRWNYGSTLAGFGFLALGLGLGSTLVSPAFQAFQADRAKTILYRCAVCSTQWNEFSREKIARQPTPAGNQKMPAPGVAAVPAPAQDAPEEIRAVMNALRRMPFPESLKKWDCVLQVEIPDAHGTVYYQWIVENAQLQIVEGRVRKPNYLLRKDAVSLFAEQANVVPLRPDGTAMMSPRSAYRAGQLQVSMKTFLSEHYPDLLEALRQRQ